MINLNCWNDITILKEPYNTTCHSFIPAGSTFFGVELVSLDRVHCCWRTSSTTDTTENGNTCSVPIYYATRDQKSKATRDSQSHINPIYRPIRGCWKISYKGTSFMKKKMRRKSWLEMKNLSYWDYDSTKRRVWIFWPFLLLSICFLSSLPQVVSNIDIEKLHRTCFRPSRSGFTVYI